MRFICPRLRLSKETHTHAKTHVFPVVLPCDVWAFGSKPPRPPPNLGASCVCEGQAAAPTREDTPGSQPHPEKTALVRAGPAARPKGGTAGEQPAACDSPPRPAAPESKTHLSSPEETRRFPRTWRETRSLRGGWKAGWISRTIFHGHDGEFDEKKRNPSVGDLISAGF